MISLDLLERIEAFRDLNDQQLSAVRTCCRELNFGCGDRLFAEGDPATHLWFIVDGEIQLRFEMPGRETSEDHTVSSIAMTSSESPAQAIGWSCFVSPFKMRLSAYCVSQSCKVIRMGKENLFTLFQEDPRMGYLFMSYMVTVVGHRFHNFQEYTAKHLGQNVMSGW